MGYRLLLTLAGVLGWLFFAFATVSGAHAQEAASKSALHDAFASGDAKAVLAGAAGRVGLHLPGSGSQYSRSQAVYVLRQFFDTYPPRRFEWQRTSTGTRSRFLTGQYWHQGAEQPLAVHLRLAKAQGEWRLHEVRVQ